MTPHSLPARCPTAAAPGMLRSVQRRYDTRNGVSRMFGVSRSIAIWPKTRRPDRTPLIASRLESAEVPELLVCGYQPMYALNSRKVLNRWTSPITPMSVAVQIGLIGVIGDVHRFNTFREFKAYM